jgi:type IV secretion system protein VirB1
MEVEGEDGSFFNPRRTGETWLLKAKAAAKQIGIAESAALAMMRTLERGPGPKAGRSIYFTLCGICTVWLLATSTFALQASPLSTTSFDQLASVCAPGVSVSTLRAVASVESHFEPWALRDNNSRKSWKAQSLIAAVILAENRLKLGHSVDLGLMQINSKNLPTLGMGIPDAFDACSSLSAGRRILLTALAAGSTETEREAALLIALSRYNTGNALAGIANGYASDVIATHGEFPAKETLPRNMQNPSLKWDIWSTSGAESEPWVIAVDGSSEIERAGAQTSDARSEGRAPASASEKGEPYVLSAVQESEPR